MLKIFGSQQVNSFLKVIIGISYFGWSAVPLIITSLEYQDRITNWNYYLFCTNVDQAFFFFTYTFFLYLVKRKRAPILFRKVDFQYDFRFVRILTLIGFFSVIYSIITKSSSDVTYLQGNDITENNTLMGIVTFISSIGVFFLVGAAVFMRDYFKKSELKVIYTVLLIYYLQIIMNGGRIYMFVFIIVLLYYALETHRKSVLIYTIALSVLALTLLPVMAELRSEGRMSFSDVAKSRSTDASDIIEHIYIKTNSVYYGSFILQNDGIGGGGFLVYASTLFALIPRNIMPNKPQPGSKNGTMYGLPSRLSAIYMSEGNYNDISNNGVSVSLESLWTMGWFSYILQIIVSAYMIFLFNGILNGKKLFFIYCLLSLINFPVCNVEISIVQIMVQTQRFIILYLILSFLFNYKKKYA